MVNKIYELKNQMIQRIEGDIQQRGIDRIDVNQMGELVDMVKDLAQAEASCMQAEYYKTVVEAMKTGSSGYGSGTGSSAGYGSMRSGYGGMDGRYGYATTRQAQSGAMGHQEVMEPLRMAIQTAGPDEREHLRNEVMQLIGRA